ncbi:MAG: hypothetical protein LBS68_01265 [Puniceicoccales bacterium]|jgi:hypothetical protein|nr:hypothetical protein [Puniceicoccales bacterium]
MDATFRGGDLLRTVRVEELSPEEAAGVPLTTATFVVEEPGDFDGYIVPREGGEDERPGLFGDAGGSAEEVNARIRLGAYRIRYPQHKQVITGMVDAMRSEGRSYLYIDGKVKELLGQLENGNAEGHERPRGGRGMAIGGGIAATAAGCGVGILIGGIPGAILLAIMGPSALGLLIAWFRDRGLL